jgi:ankyrin repeat protein
MRRFNEPRPAVRGRLETAADARALLAAGAPVNGRPGDRETPLITAASYGDAEVAHVLIKAGADLEAKSAANAGGIPEETALAHAAVFGMTDVLDLLVAAGARVHSLEEAAAAGDISGWLKPDSPLQAKIRALVFAADHQRLPVIDRLIEADTPVDAFDEVWNRQALRTAAQNGRPASVRRLLDHGADPNLRDDDDLTALDWCSPARRYLDGPGHAEVEAILRPLTTSQPAPRNEQAASRQSLLRAAFTALDDGDTEPLRALLDPQAQWIGIPQGETATETPTCPNQAAILDLLEHHHANGRRFQLGKLIEERDRIAAELTVHNPNWSSPVTIYRVFTFHDDTIVRLNDCIDESYALQILKA